MAAFRIVQPGGLQFGEICINYTYVTGPSKFKEILNGMAIL